MWHGLTRSLPSCFPSPRMRAAWLLAVLLVALPVRSGAQNLPTALPFLEIPPSPALNAMGSAGVAQTEADAYGFLVNPARLGLTARDVRAATALYPTGSTSPSAAPRSTPGSTCARRAFR